MEHEEIITQQMEHIGLVEPSQNPVNSSQNLVGLVGTKNQLNPTKNQLNSTKIQQLSEQGQQAKRELEILVATGKSKDLTGKTLTFNDLDCMSEKDLLRFYGVYQSTVSSRVNDSFSKIFVKSYCSLANWLLPIENKEKLYDDLRNDYILNSELDRWIGWGCLKMGSFAALTSSTLITFNNCNFSDHNFSEKIEQNQNPVHRNSSEINEH